LSIRIRDFLSRDQDIKTFTFYFGLVKTKGKEAGSTPPGDQGRDPLITAIGKKKKTVSKFTKS